MRLPTMHVTEAITSMWKQWEMTSLTNLSIITF